LFVARQQKALQSATLAAKQLGQYHLEEKLGAGGMGTVYKARHAMLRRPTAVKLLDVDKMSDAAIARFEREVQLTSTLTHPNTVAVFDYGRTPEGVFYYAMEYLEGLNLDDLVTRTGPLPVARAHFILAQICGSLAEAHAAGMVHRDVKPANILLTRRGGIHDFVKVLDFGLAKDVAGTEQANVTSPNALMGTPLYLSPEAVSKPDSIDARSDVYAVGAVAYFLITGSPVFDGATVMEICMKHTKEQPVPPSERLGNALHPEMEALVLRCLSKSPQDRPSDAGALLIELERVTLTNSWTASDAASWWAARDSNATIASPVELASVPDTSSPEHTVAYEEPK
jgi:serine/threonine protein kinase